MADFVESLLSGVLAHMIILPSEALHALEACIDVGERSNDLVITSRFVVSCSIYYFLEKACKVTRALVTHTYSEVWH